MLKGTEVQVGDFRLDILAQDEEENLVIIENQFGSTDHGHLGQLISYVATQGGMVTAIWISGKVKDSHRGAIDWLNTNTGEGFDFFAVEIGALKIDDSNPAPFFKVVAKPNNWTRRAGPIGRPLGSTAGTDSGKYYLAYWSSFSQYLSEKGVKFNISMRRRHRKNYNRFPIGRPDITILVLISTLQQRASVQLLMERDPDNRVIDKFFIDKESIEKEFGESLQWTPAEDGEQRSRIIIHRTITDLSDQNSYRELHEWMLEKMTKFDRIFRQRIQNLPLDEIDDSEPSEEP